MSRRRAEPHDRLVLLVVGGLLLLAVVALAILGALALLERDAPDLLLGALVSVLGTATGALGAVLTQTGRGTQEVQVVNPPAEPVPTEPVGG